MELHTMKQIEGYFFHRLYIHLSESDIGKEQENNYSGRFDTKWNFEFYGVFQHDWRRLYMEMDSFEVLECTRNG